MVHADEISTKELVVTAAESVAGFLGLEQRETAMSGGNFIQSNAYTTKVSGIVVEEEIVLPRRGLSWMGFEIWFMLYRCSADRTTCATTVARPEQELFLES